MVEDRINKFIGVGMVQWVYHVSWKHPTTKLDMFYKIAQRHFLAGVVKNVLVRVVPTSLVCSVGRQG